MRNISNKQAVKNREVDKIKRSLANSCIICGNPGYDAAHLVPKSMYPEYYTNPKNIVIMCRDCHNNYDNDRDFRKKQKHLIARVDALDALAANRYFDL